jgi:hypothetical protein
MLLPLQGNERCLEHDSYLELRGVIEYYETEVDDALRYPHNHLGPLSGATLRAVIEFVRTAKTLTSEERDRIAANLTSVL